MKSPAFNLIGPWLPPEQPDLARLAMEAADAEGVAELRAWPERRKGGVGFGALPPFLAWRGAEGDRQHLVLVQAREVGALVPGARLEPLPEGWLEVLDLPSLARPLVRLAGPGRGQVRTWGEPGAGVVPGVLERLTGWREWRLEPA